MVYSGPVFPVKFLNLKSDVGGVRGFSKVVATFNHVGGSFN